MHGARTGQGFDFWQQLGFVFSFSFVNSRVAGTLAQGARVFYEEAGASEERQVCRVAFSCVACVAIGGEAGSTRVTTSPHSIALLPFARAIWALLHAARHDFMAATLCRL